MSVDPTYPLGPQGGRPGSTDGVKLGRVRLPQLRGPGAGVRPIIVSVGDGLIAVGIGLWWSAIDENFRRLQPFLAMSNDNLKYSQGINPSYKSSYWVWAAPKAARNRHWLLFLITLGATLTPICRKNIP